MIATNNVVGKTETWSSTRLVHLSGEGGRSAQEHRNLHTHVADPISMELLARPANATDTNASAAHLATRATRNQARCSPSLCATKSDLRPPNELNVYTVFQKIPISSKKSISIYIYTFDYLCRTKGIGIVGSNNNCNSEERKIFRKYFLREGCQPLG